MSDIQTDTAIAPSDTVNAILHDHPATMSALNAFGVDVCCGGGLTLAEAAQAGGIDLGALLEAVSAAARGDRAAS